MLTKYIYNRYSWVQLSCTSCTEISYALLNFVTLASCKEAASKRAPTYRSLYYCKLGDFTAKAAVFVCRW
jgi:hypothetical protein